MERNSIIRVLISKRIYWAICAILLILNVLFYVFVVGSQRKKINGLQELYAKARIEKASHRKTGKLSYIRAKKELQLFKELLPPKTAFADLVKEIYDILDKLGLNMIKMTYQSERTDPISLWKYTTSFTATGSYAQLKQMLAGIQNSQSLFCIEGVSFENRSTEEERVQMKLTLSTYLR